MNLSRSNFGRNSFWERFEMKATQHGKMGIQNPPDIQGNAWVEVKIGGVYRGKQLKF
jgi:hypothetical protein